MRQWVNTRHADGAERTLLTTVQTSALADVADLIFTAATQRLYADGGHLMEDCNKTLQIAGLMGQERDSGLFPLLIARSTGGRGAEETTDWHHPVALAEPLLGIEEELEPLLARPGESDVPGYVVDLFSGDDPLATIDAMKQVLSDGTCPAKLVRAVAFAAGSRLARFATSNEVTDWFNPQHTFIHANAVYLAVQRAPIPSVVRGVFHGAVAVYMDRFLNVPAARLPRERGVGPSKTAQSETLAAFHDLLDQRANIDDAASVISGYLQAGYDIDALVDGIPLATVREDLGFHSLQVLEVAVCQCVAWADEAENKETILVGVVRNLAAHCPTRRAGQQTARIALKLQRGERIFEEEEASTG